MAGGGLVKGGSDDFSFDRTLHLGHFFRALVDQQDHHVAIGVIGGNRVGDVLHHHGLTALRRRNHQSTLAFADGRDDVDDAAGDVFLTLGVLFELHVLAWKQGGQVFKHDLVFVVLRQVVVDFVELGKRKVALAVFGDANFAFDHVTRMQVEAAHLAWADVDIVGAGGVAGVWATQEAKTVGQDLEDTVGKHLFASAGALFDDGEHELLLAHAARVFNFEFFGLFQHFRHVQCLEFVQVHR